MPAGGRTIFLEDAGNGPRLSSVGVIPEYNGSEYPATFGQSADEAGNVYVQWHRRDNAGRVEILKLVDGKVRTDFVKGTETAIQLPGLLSFASVAPDRVMIDADLDLYRAAIPHLFGEVLVNHLTDSCTNQFSVRRILDQQKITPLGGFQVLRA